MQYIFASDPHGTGQPWIELVKKAQKKYPHNQTIFGGDYIDGRKHSKETLDFIIDQVQNNNAIALRGNHEQMMLDFIGSNDELWYYNGAKSTVKSLFNRGYSKPITRHKILQSPYYEFIKKLTIVYETKHIIFVHGAYPLNNQTYQPYDYLWNRESYWWKDSKTPIFAHNTTNKTIVTGHTPTCLITGRYDFAPNHPIPPNPKNQVLKIKYPNEKPRYFTDGGCHGTNNDLNGNICVFDENGILLEVFN